MKKNIILLISTALLSLVMCASDVPIRTLELPPGPDNPRNSEGAFISLKDGRTLFVYSHYTAGNGGDHDPAHLVARESSDGGSTWSDKDKIIVENEGAMNVMSVSLLRLQSGDIALFYLLKNSTTDCRPLMRVSKDEGKSWGKASECITDEVAYYVMNNDRAIQLKSGRLVLPVCLHTIKDTKKMDWQGTVMCYLSDDNGRTWRRSKTTSKGYDTTGKRITTQEPGVVELKDGGVMMFIRASGGCQYLSYSSDSADTWSAPIASDIKSPVSPASIKRLPSTGDLLLVWNNHADIPSSLKGMRVPLSTAISKDDGKTWQHIKVLEGNPKGWYCYIAIYPVDDVVLLGYSAMSYLKHARVTRVPLSWLYKDGPAPVAVRQEALLFEKAAKGAFVKLETALGVWSAEEGHAEVYTYARGKGVHIMGGENRTLLLTLPQPVACSVLNYLGVERFTSKAPYQFTLEAKVEDIWRKIWEQNASTPVGYPLKINVIENLLKSSQFRFKCTSVKGVIIGDIKESDMNGYFKD